MNEDSDLATGHYNVLLTRKVFGVQAVPVDPDGTFPGNPDKVMKKSPSAEIPSLLIPILGETIHPPPTRPSYYL